MEHAVDQAPVDPATLQSAVRSGRHRSNILLGLFVTMGLGFMSWMGTDLVWLYLLRRGRAGAPVSDREVELHDLIKGLVALPLLPVAVAAVVMWIFWLYRVYANLRLVGRREMTYSMKWAIGCWFIPIVNLFAPYHVVSDVVLRSEDGNTAADIERSGGPSRVLTWWLLMWASRVIDRLVTRGAGLLNTSAETTTILDMSSLAIDRVALSLGFLIVLQVRDAQDRWQTRAESPVASVSVPRP